MKKNSIIIITIIILCAQIAIGYSMIEKNLNAYFCAVDDCEMVVSDLIKNAQESVYFMTFSFTSEEIAEAIVDNKRIKVKGVFEKVQNSKYSKYKFLKDNQINVKLDNNRYYMHHKVFIIDKKIVVTGSFNPTTSGNERNDENLIVIKDEKVAEQFMKEFRRVWGK